MFEKRLSEIPEPNQFNRRSSIVSNSDTEIPEKPENKSSFQTYIVLPFQTFFRSHIVRPYKETPIIFYSVILIILSILFLFILLIGSSRTIYLSKFTFDAPIKFITNKSDITFTLYGYCVDDQCTTPSLVNNFDKLPSSSELTNSSSIQKRIDISAPSIQAPSIQAPSIQAPSIPSPSIPDVAPAASTVISGAENTASNVANTAANTATNVANTAVNAAEDIAAKAKALLPQLLNSFNNFKPKSPTANIAGFFSIPYLLALIFNIISLPLLYFHFTIIAALLIIISSILNLLACCFDLLIFVSVFDLIALIPGIGSQQTGPAIYLATLSAALLTVAAMLLCISSCSDAARGISKCLKKLRKTKVNDTEQGKPYNYF